MGHYEVDDDSVKPQPITLVDEGVLKTYYMSRVPTKLVKQTNGHARDGDGAPGNLFVETRSPQTMAALTKRLLELAKDEDYDYGIVVEDFDTAMGMRWGRLSEIGLPMPSLIYRVYADGRKELVRGYTFKQISFRVLKDIDGMGDDPTLANVDLRNQRTSSVAPSVLVHMLELQKSTTEFEKPPYTPRPVAKR
jgi:predicted Zn-dependent protease